MICAKLFPFIYLFIYRNVWPILFYINKRIIAEIDIMFFLQIYLDTMMSLLVYPFVMNLIAIWYELIFENILFYFIFYDEGW